MNSFTQTAVLGSGCFGLAEAVFKRIKGISNVQEGYAGGHTKCPKYEDVCKGDTGHIEVIKFIFDESIINYGEILRIFFAMHDPYSLDKQGRLNGAQYRSVIFYTDIQQKKQATAIIKELSSLYSEPVVTQVLSMPTFWPAEDYWHENFDNNPDQDYCKNVIAPQLLKIQHNFLRYF